MQPALGYTGTSTPPSLLLPARASCWHGEEKAERLERRREPPHHPESVHRGSFSMCAFCRVGVQLTSPPLSVQRETRFLGNSRLLSCQERTLLLRHHRHVLSVQRAVARLQQELLDTAQLLQVGTCTWAGGSAVGRRCLSPGVSWDVQIPCKNIQGAHERGGSDGGQVGQLLTGGPKEVSWARWPWPGPGGGGKLLWSWERT